MHLRGAAEAVGILHVLLVALDNLAALQHLTHGGGGLQLAFVRAHHVEALVERLYAAVESIQAQAQHHVGLTAQAHGLQQTPHSVAAHKLRAVQQGQTLFALQLDGLPAFGLIDLRHIAAAAFPIHLSHAQDGRQHQVGQRAEVAAGAERTLLIHHRQHILVVAVNQALHRLQLCAAVAEAEILRFQQQHQAHHLGGHLVAHAARMAHHQVLLQLAQLLLADADVAQRAESRRHTVDGLLLALHLVVQIGAAFLDATLGLLAQREGHLLIDNLLYLRKSQSLFRIELVGHS